MKLLKQDEKLGSFTSSLYICDDVIEKKIHENCSPLK